MTHRGTAKAQIDCLDRFFCRLLSDEACPFEKAGVAGFFSPSPDPVLPASSSHYLRSGIINDRCLKLMYQFL
jgi:hypothetical protein